MDALFVKGAILGFTMAAPVGPVGLMTIRTSISRGRLYGQVMAAAVATSDAMYGAVAAFGLTFISDPIFQYRYYISFIGGLALFGLAVKIFISKLDSKKKTLNERSKVKVFASTLLLNLSNPSNIFSFAAAFAAFGMASKKSTRLDATLIVAGVFIGSGLWFSVLSWFSAKHRAKMNDRVMAKVNKLAGVLLAIFSGYFIITGYRGLAGY